MRVARAALAAAVAFAPVAVVALPALPARAAECVRVVVDYGTSSGANTHCTNADGIAAEVLAKRARELGRPAPRYRGNFLCAIDGYPESGCGDHGTEPYWSFWLWVDGRWVYSSQGVDTYTVRDSDRDGHPDPIGFRYHEFETKRSPRATPSYPKPTTAPPAATKSARPAPTTAAPPREAPTTTAPAGAGTVARTGTVAEADATAAPATDAASGTPASDVTGTPTPGAPTDAPVESESDATPEAAATFAEPPPSSRPPSGGGIPLDAVAVVLLAGGLFGAAAYRSRRNA